MSGRLYAIGVGPGDPELLTLKAVRLINEADVIACPAKGAEPGTAYGIAVKACPQMEDKEKLVLDFPMRGDDLAKAHRKAADQIVEVLQAGKDVAFLTLGDPGFYSSYFYIAEMIAEHGFETEIVSGITSFCAVSATLKLPLVLGNEPVLITAGEYRDFDGTLVVMKAGSKLPFLKGKAAAAGKMAYLVENCGMPDEKVYADVVSMPDEAGYFSIFIIK
ncbi:MAG: precorrin-2 C(20)-methyltransferase [Lachnospiraceae bacterium]|nr:precorrin-2 C(20)-methyltransferase [Lachnospiraceae bacterium]